MRFHWYFPFMRSEELAWAQGTARPGESIVVQCVDRPLAPEAGEQGAITVLRDLADVDRDVPRWRWPASRTMTYLSRASARQRLWAVDPVDLVHVHYINRFTDALAPMMRPLVLSVHDVTPHHARLGRAEHLVLRRVYRRGEALVVHHRSLRDLLLRDFDLDPHRVHVVPHEVFPAPRVTSPATDEPPAFLFFGALRPNKGLDVLLEALERLRGADVRVIIAGKGDARVESLALRAARHDPRITLELERVPLSRKRELFAAASVVVLPYTAFASQSGVLHDAYAFERPVVVTDVGALGNAVREDGTGLVARPDDPMHLAEQMLAALKPRRWADMSRAAAVIRQERSPERTGQRLRGVYDAVL